MAYFVMCIIGYLLGCSNLAFLLAKAKGVDLAGGGSGNPGASNVTILMGWRLGVLVLSMTRERRCLPLSWLKYYFRTQMVLR